MHFISILGFDRSGTTFFGNYLSQFSQKAFYAGEIDKGLEKYFSGAKEQCSCGQPYEKCVVWGKILPHLKDEQDVETLLKKLEEVTGAEVIIDSSKKKKYIKKFSTLYPFDYSIFHIVRDPRAVALSRTKNRKKRVEKNTHPKPFIAKRSSLMMFYDSLEWSFDNMWMEFFKRPFKHKNLIYENLDGDTKKTIQGFLDGRDIGIGTKEIENHILWGSSSSRMQRVAKIKINMSWRKELSGIQKNIINALSYPVRKRYNYSFPK